MEERSIILAIDDNVQQLKEFSLFLSPRFDLRAVKSASEALSFLNKNLVNLVLLDIEMPNVNGFEFLKDIRKIPSYMTVPIIIISSSTGEEYFERAKNSSASAVLSKPVNRDKLIQVIEKNLK